MAEVTEEDTEMNREQREEGAKSPIADSPCRGLLLAYI